MTLQPPFIVVIPQRLRTISYLRIPQMGPSSKTKFRVALIPAAEVLEHPFLKKDRDRFQLVALHVLNTFVPWIHRSVNIAYLQLYRLGGSDEDIIVQFSKAPPLHPPRVAKQSQKRFARHPPSPSTFMLNDNFFTFSRPHHLDESSLSVFETRCNVKSFQYVARRGNFVKPSERNFKMDLPTWVWNSASSPGTLCPISGVGMVVAFEAVARAQTHVVGLARFQ